MPAQKNQSFILAAIFLKKFMLFKYP